ncbi:MAG: hypothetical protein PUE01_00810 [Clostridiaceae bacterium]|nr:hypothetical protein [Clostridiaceae bacterium]
MSKYTEDDFCDLYERKICDNCGKCLEAEGIDTKAIRIEDIAKTVDENKELEEEYMNELEAQKASLETESNEDELKKLQEAYSAFEKETGLDLTSDDEYEDAFEHIEYLDDFDVNDETSIEEMTEEIFPGVRKLKKKVKKEE